MCWQQVMNTFLNTKTKNEIIPTAIMSFIKHIRYPVAACTRTKLPGTTVPYSYKYNLKTWPCVLFSGPSITDRFYERNVVALATLKLNYIGNNTIAYWYKQKHEIPLKKKQLAHLVKSTK